MRRAAPLFLVIAAALTLGYGDRSLTLQGWLFAWHLFMGMSLGSLGFIMLADLTGGAWGEPTLDFFRAAAMVTPWMALLFLPIVLGASMLYPWTHDPAIHNAAWLNLPFWTLRTLVYLILGSWGCRVMARPHRPQAGAPGLVLLVLTISMAAVDWGMSLEPHWYSTVYGLFFVLGDAVCALAAAIIALDPATRPRLCRDLGGLLLAFVMLLTYVQFAQWVIIWSGNLPHEVSWYRHRIDHGWCWPALALLVCGLFAPFLALLFASNRQRPQRLKAIAAVVLAAMICQYFWWLVPGVRPLASLTWTDLTCFLIVGGIWTIGYLSQRRPSHAGL